MPAELLIEVRCEELPASYIRPALLGLRDGVLGLLKGVDTGAVRLFSTPRRLAVCIADVAEARPLVEKLVTGPPLAAAQRDGEWTKAALGFARGKGLTPDDLQIVDGPRGQVVGASVKSGGERTADLLAAGLDKVLRNLPSKKSMRWGTSDIRFARPLHQLIVVLHGETVPVEAAELTSGNSVLGHRRSPLAPGPVATGDAYVAALRERSVLVDRDERRQVVLDGETGFIANPFDVPAYAARIGSLLGDAQLRQRMGEAGHKRLLERFTIERLTDEFLAVYRDAIASKRDTS